MDPFDLPNAISSCIVHGRRLYYRLVFLLGMDPSISIEIIAFWLLVEGNGEVGFLQHINFFHGDHFLALVAMGKQFIDAMHTNLVDLRSRSTNEFQEEVISRICFFLKNVCYEVLRDLREKDEPVLAVHDSSHHYQGEGLLSRSMSSAIKCLQEMVKTSIYPRPIIVPTTIQNHQDMVKRRHGSQSMNAFSINLDINNTQQQKNMGVDISSISNIYDLESLFRHCTVSPQLTSEWGTPFPQSSTVNKKPCFYSRVHHHFLVPQDDRTLFVTFSNGHPLTKDEVYGFFMSKFGDVESLSIEDPAEVRPPQYALVTLGSLETMLIILDGKEKVKFLAAGGKHLWARRYVPKRSTGRAKNMAWI
ncbi:hypothetical protein BS78_01G013800 [Paspalum vaginatum]|nr:hypothetical protein BS78_01G013800 [Paspalum vaginatum]